MKKLLDVTPQEKFNKLLKELVYVLLSTLFQKTNPSAALLLNNNENST